MNMNIQNEIATILCLAAWSTRGSAMLWWALSNETRADLAAGIERNELTTESVAAKVQEYWEALSTRFGSAIDSGRMSICDVAAMVG